MTSITISEFPLLAKEVTALRAFATVYHLATGDLDPNSLIKGTELLDAAKPYVTILSETFTYLGSDVILTVLGSTIKTESTKDGSTNLQPVFESHMSRPFVNPDDFKAHCHQLDDLFGIGETSSEDSLSTMLDSIASTT